MWRSWYKIRTLTFNKPKPMVEVAGKPFLEHLILQLKKMELQKYCY